jgi:hypothetical protein
VSNPTDQPRPCARRGCDRVIASIAGTVGRPRTYCTPTCRRAAKRARRPGSIPSTIQRRGRIDLSTIAGVRHEVEIDPATDCWNWQRHIGKDGYPRSRYGTVHRSVARLVHGDIGTQPVHHTCGNTRCVSPDHLVPISQRENAAEMLERNWYLTHIAELRAALAKWAPLHPLLDVVAPPTRY